MRTCSITGTKMSEGWVFFDGEAYASTQEIADQIAQEYGYQDFNDLYEQSGGDDESNSYWTTWEEDDNDDDDDTGEQELQDDSNLNSYRVEVKTTFTTYIVVKAGSEAEARQELQQMFGDGRFNEAMLEQCENESEVVKVEQEVTKLQPDYTSEVDAIESDVKLSIQEGFDEGYVDSGLNEAIVKLYRLGIDVKELKASESNQLQAHYILSAISQWRAKQC